MVIIPTIARASNRFIGIIPTFLILPFTPQQEVSDEQNHA
uniref:Uncharacterized protein n=1 Tax=Siphoviridae sp. cteRK31 TaxID=2826405 RepID=A0A8S5MKP3_9CAUD|nr:MAG TPA: hypothetical protein [Siphoviridae sp. cteRK31]